MKKLFLLALGGLAFAAPVNAACPPITVADMKGVAAGAYPQQYELSEFEAAANCKMSFSTNPDIYMLDCDCCT